MSDEISADDYKLEEYRVPGARDRVVRRVHDGHDANQVLHDTLQAAFGPGEDTPTCNLMASHAPGEQPGRPTYHVWVESRNEGGGHPIIPTPVRRLVERDDAVMTGVAECSDDHLIVTLRAVTTRVEPITIDKPDAKRLADRAGVRDE